MAGIKHIRSSIAILQLMLTSEKAISRLNFLRSQIEEYHDESRKAQQAIGKKQQEVVDLKAELKKTENIKASLDNLTAANGKLLRKLKRIENKQHK